MATTDDDRADERWYRGIDDGDEYDGDGRDGDECFWCGGEGVSECVNQLECMNSHDRFGLCRCASCGGSGLAKDMTIW